MLRLYKLKRYPLLLLFTILLQACAALPSGVINPSINLPVTATARPTFTPFTQVTKPAATPVPVEISQITVAAPTAAGAPAEPTPAPTQTHPDSVRNHIRYILDAQLDYANHHAEVQETVIYTNTTGVPLNSLIFYAEPNRITGVFDLKSVSIDGNSPTTGYILENNRLELPLPAPLQPLSSIRINADFELALPEIPPPSDQTRPVSFGYTTRQTNLVDWYLFLPPYVPGKGFLWYPPWFYGEHQSYDLGDFQVKLHITDENLQPVVAASSIARKDGNTYEYELSQARSFAISASLDYQVYTETVGSVTVYSYAFPFAQDAGEAALHDTAKALALYSELYGPYPHSSLTVVEADFMDGMEYDGLYFLSRGFYNLYDGSPAGYLTAIAVHETAHQWWYGLVGNDQYKEPWLDEALCTYSERIYYQRTYPLLADWWWQFRVNFYHPEGPMNKDITFYGGFRPYVNAVYLRGAMFLEDLRTLMGDDAFFAFLKDYAAQESGHISTANDFFAILSKHTQADFGSIIDKYFQR